MITKIQKWGNSLALRIPNSLAKEIKIIKDSEVELKMIKGKIIISPVETGTYSLKDLLKGIDKKNIHQEISLGSPIGKELW